MYRFKIDTTDAMNRLGRLLAAFKNPRHFMQLIAEELHRIARASFQNESSPEGVKWAPLSIRYALRKAKLGKGSQGILRFRGQLFRSLRRGVDGKVAWATAGPLAHAGIHQHGGKTGRKHRVMMPARPYLGFPQDSQERVARDIEQAVEQTWKGSRKA